MSKETPSNNHSPSFYQERPHVKLPASVLTRDSKDQMFLDVVQRLMGVIAQHLPATQEGLQEIRTHLQQAVTQISNSEGVATLKGHGPRGSVMSEQIENDEHAREFAELLPKPAKHPITAEMISKQLQQYMGFTTDSDVQIAWPSPEIFGSLVHELVEDIDLSEADDGFYVMNTEKQQYFVLRLRVSPDTLFLWSSTTGQSIWTYVKAEGQYILHRSFDYLEGPLVMDALANFFAKADVHAPTPAEVRRVVKSLRKLNPELIPPTLAELRPDSASLKIVPTLTMVCDNEGQFRVESGRGDHQWEDLTPFTQRQYFKAYVRRIEEETQDSE